MPKRYNRWDGTKWKVLIGSGESTVEDFVVEQTRPVPGVNVGCRIPRNQLTVYNGDYIITTPNITVSGLLVKGRILVRALNVTVEDCIAEATQAYFSGSPCMIDTSHSSARFARIRFCEVSSRDFPNNTVNGIGPKSYAAERCYVHDSVDGFAVYDTTGQPTSTPQDNVSIVACYATDLFYITPDPNHSDNRTHNDITQLQGGPGEVLIQGCDFQGYDSGVSTNGGSATGYSLSVIMLNTTSQRHKSYVKIWGNWLNGGGDTINGRGTDGGTVEIKRNKFGPNRSFYAITANVTLSTTWDIPLSGSDVNVWEATGLPIASFSTFTQSNGTQTVRRYS